MDPETTRSRLPSGLFSDESSAVPVPPRRSVSDGHPYRGARESLIARRHALERELATVDASLDEAATSPAPSPLSVTLADLGAIFLPRRAIGVVMAGILTGVGVSSLLAYQVGVCSTMEGDGQVVVVERGRRFDPTPRDESPAEHAMRRRKDGEALLMSSLFASPDDARRPAPQITRVGPTTWEVDESVLDSPESPYTSMRMVPHVSRDGRVDGIRLFGLRPDGMEASLGLRNGDVVLRANGIEVTGADGAFAAVEIMRRTRYLELELERDGRLVAQHYLIAAR